MRVYSRTSLIVISVVLAGLLVCVVLTPQRGLIIGYQRTLLYLPVFVAEEKGFFQEQGLSVQLKKFDSANLMMQALLSKQIQVTGMSALNVLATVQNEQPGLFRIFLFEVFTKKEHADHILVSPDSAIDSLSDLKGKRIGVHPGTTIKMYARMALGQFLNVDRDVELIELAPALQVQALATGQVDALFSLEPVSAIALSKGLARDLGGVIAQYTIDPAYPGASVFSEVFVKDKPDLAHRVQIAVYKAVDFIREHPEEAKRILADYLNLDPTILPHLKLIGWAKVEEVNVTHVQKLIDIYAEQKIIKSMKLPSAAYFQP